MANWYLGSTKHAAVAQWAAGTPYSVGDFVRQLAAPSVGNERVFRCTTAGTSGGSEPSWNLSKGATTNDNTAVWTEVTGNETYGWDAAGARLGLFLTSNWAAAGDTVYRSNNHAETQSSNMFLTSSGTAASPIRILTVDDSAAPPTALATTASITTTGNSFIVWLGYAYDYGCTYTAGTGAVNTLLAFDANSPWWWRFEECVFGFGGTGGSSIRIGTNTTSQDDRLLEFINCDVNLNDAADGFTLDGPFVWIGGSVTGVAPTNLFKFVSTGPGGKADIRGVDLSLLDSGENLVAINSGEYSELRFENCKLGASVSITSGSVAGQGGVTVKVVNCDSADTNYRYYLQNYEGVVTHEATIVRDNPSRKVVTSANVKPYRPLVLDPIVFYNTTIGSVTAEVEIVNDGETYTDAEVWLEVEYLGTSGFPLSLVASDRVSDPIFGTPANQTSSSVSWTTTGLASPVKQTLSVTFTVAEEGVAKLRVCVAKASTTLYVDPKATIS